ncbi:hypothetical protein HZS_5058 [Henneguya salminicola]|nr:hypothetical protein HZS_5058 [Henneguya salminicola]
MKIEQKILR